MDKNIKDMDRILLLYSTKAFILCFVCLCPEKSDAAYFPNYGYVGCYNYTNHMEKLKLFNLTSNETKSMTAHSCIQICLKEYNSKYAGLMAGKKCFCGNEYNQTFATTEEHCNIACSDSGKCGGNGKITIYNTETKLYLDYDVKPLLSIPGNNTKFLEAWDKEVTMKFGNMFTDSVMRSPAIDWWNQDKLYHTPEYVSMMAFNQHGQLLWAINFFTNNTNANILNWMKKDRVLSNEFLNSTSIRKLKISISPEKNEIQITESESGHVWFHHGDVNKDKATVTVVSPEKKPLSVSYNKSMDHIPICAVCRYDQQEPTFKLCYYLALSVKECNCSNVVDGNCVRYFWNGNAVCPLQLIKRYPVCCHCCQWKERNCSNVVDENCTRLLWNGNAVCSWTDCCCCCQGEMRNCQIDCLENCKKHALKQHCNETCLFNTTFHTQEPNYGMRRVRQYQPTLKFQDGKYVSNLNKEKIFCGFNLTDPNITKIEMNITDSNEEKITIETDLSNNGDLKLFRTCFRAQKLTTNVNLTMFELEDDALLMVDRIAVLGFYHKEEPKVSKWEFLNDYSPEEVLNIMRPVLQKTKSAGEVAVRNLSSSIRKKESAIDYRKSSKGIGILGVCLLVFVFLIIFVSDIFIINAHLKVMYRTILRLFRPSPRVRAYSQVD